MMKVKYTNQLDDKICTFEDSMLEIYTKKIQAYTIPFETIGCTLKVGLIWKSFFDGNAVSYKRAAFRNGYECYVYCSVQKGGQEVRISSKDDVADYYYMSTAWMISLIRRFFLKLELSLCVNTENVESDLENFLIYMKITSNVIYS